MKEENKQIQKISKNTFKTYLKARYSAATVKKYLHDVDQFRNYSRENIEKADYRDVMEYVRYLRSKGQSGRHINNSLYGLKSYYNYLVTAGKREDHPCSHLLLKDAQKEPLLHQDLYTKQQLESLKERKERYKEIGSRNQLLIGLMIYQALRLKELLNLKIEDVNLDQRTIFIKGSVNTNGRVLMLLEGQLEALKQYVEMDRDHLQKKSKAKEFYLLLNNKGNRINASSILNVLQYYEQEIQEIQIMGRVTVQKIRQSVIANKLKEGHDIRTVQLFAGHQHVSSTERYKQDGLEELMEVVSRCHPMRKKILRPKKDQVG